MAIIQHTIFDIRKKHGRKLTTDPAPKGKKQCTGCRKFKLLSSFSRMTQSNDGLDYRCKTCTTKKDKANQYNHKVSSWERHYGISEHVYWDLFEEQGGVCAICKQPETKVHRGTLSYLSVDHDHATGRVRGLLCHRCNHALGLMQDRQDWLSAMIEYLKR